MARGAARLLVLAVVVVAVVAPASSGGAASTRHHSPFAGLGTWVDIYSAEWADPETAVAAMAQHGVKTLYLETGNYSHKENVFRPHVAGRFIDAAEAERAGLVNRVVPRAKLEEATMALAQEIAERDPYALKLAKASVNETQDAQGWRQAMENAFKNYMLTIPHRIEMGTYGPKAREKAPKDRFAVLNKKTV